MSIVRSCILLVPSGPWLASCQQPAPVHGAAGAGAVARVRRAEPFRRAAMCTRNEQCVYTEPACGEGVDETGLRGRRDGDLGQGGAP